MAKAKPDEKKKKPKPKPTKAARKPSTYNTRHLEARPAK
jgi:hypothetical protein